jgi:D-arginine dehydrogenase
MNADVVVVGGGIAGVSVAAALSARCSVVLVEREPLLAHHSTGRSAAAFLQSYGSREVRRLTRASRGIFEQISQEDELAGRLLSPRGLLWVATEDQLPRLHRLCDSVPGLEPLDAEAVMARCPALRHVAGGALERDAQDIDVPALHQHFVRVARTRGVRILQGSPIVSGHRAGGSWQVRTPRHTIRASIVVNAAGAWADEVAVALKVRPVGVVPLRRTVAVARASTAVDPGWPLVMDVDEGFYFKPEGPHVLVSPADENPSRPCDAQPDEVDVAIALDRVNKATALGLRSIVSAWTGLRTFARDRNPVVGADEVAPGFFWLAGQGGYGIQMAPALARLVAALIAEEPAGERHVDVPLARLSPRRFAAARGPRWRSGALRGGR